MIHWSFCGLTGSASYHDCIMSSVYSLPQLGLLRLILAAAVAKFAPQQQMYWQYLVEFGRSPQFQSTSVFSKLLRDSKRPTQSLKVSFQLYVQWKNILELPNRTCHSNLVFISAVWHTTFLLIDVSQVSFSGNGKQPFNNTLVWLLMFCCCHYCLSGDNSPSWSSAAI